MNVQMDIKVKGAKEHPVAQTHVKMVEHVRYRDQVTFAIVDLDSRGHIVVLHPVAQIHAKMVEHVRYLDHGSNAIVLLDTRGHIVVLHLVAQIHAKMVEHVMFSIVIHRPNTWLLVVVSRGSMETNVSTHHAQIIPV